MPDLRQEQRGPETAFSVEALLQEQWRALSLPQEHLAWAAQTQVPSWEVLQQVVAGLTIVTVMLEMIDLEIEMVFCKVASLDCFLATRCGLGGSERQ